MFNKKIITLLLLAPAVSFATNVAQAPAPHQDVNTSTVSQTNASAGASAGASAAGAVTVTNNILTPAEQTIKNTPSMFNGALTSSHDTCLGSASGGIVTPGFGFSIGGTNIDKNCVMRKNADLLYRMGMTAAALSLVCSEDESIKKALESTGFKCPQ